VCVKERERAYSRSKQAADIEGGLFKVLSAAAAATENC
jgi:hypothetical protein